MSDDLRHTVRLLETLADENRIRLLKCLQVHAACVGELAQALDMPQPRASHHLRILHDAGLVEDSRDAQRVKYALVEAPEGSPEAEVVALLAGWLEGDPVILEDRRRSGDCSEADCSEALDKSLDIW